MYNTYRTKIWKIRGGQYALQSIGTGSVSPIIRGWMKEAQDRGFPGRGAKGGVGQHTMLLLTRVWGPLLERRRSSLTVGAGFGMIMLLRPLRSVDEPLETNWAKFGARSNVYRSLDVLTREHHKKGSDMLSGVWSRRWLNGKGVETEGLLDIKSQISLIWESKEARKSLGLSE